MEWTKSASDKTHAETKEQVRIVHDGYSRVGTTGEKEATSTRQHRSGSATETNAVETKSHPKTSCTVVPGSQRLKNSTKQGHKRCTSHGPKSGASLARVVVKQCGSPEIGTKSTTDPICHETPSISAESAVAPPTTTTDRSNLLRQRQPASTADPRPNQGSGHTGNTGTLQPTDRDRSWSRTTRKS